MTGADLRRTATVQGIVRCLVRALQQRRAAVLEQVPASGGPIAEEARPLSVELDKLDQARVDPAEGNL